MKVVQKSVSREETEDPVSLKDFALENFRYDRHMAVFKILKNDGKRKKACGFPCDRPAGSRHGAHKSEKLWACSKDLLRQPLLKNLMHNSELSNLACNAFTDIHHLIPVILPETYHGL